MLLQGYIKYVQRLLHWLFKAIRPSYIYGINKIIAVPVNDNKNPLGLK